MALRPPHPLLARFAAITFVLVAALGWLSWRLLEQDRALERQRTRDGLENAADAIAAGLERSIAELEDSLGRLAAAGDATRRAQRVAATLGEDAVLLIASADRFDAYPGGRLLHTPLPPAEREPSAKVFARGDSLEFRAQNPRAASTVYQTLATSRDLSVRAAALLRLGRAYRKSNRAPLAASAYQEMTSLNDALVNGLPAALIGRAARVSLWQETGDTSALRREATELHEALHASQWPVRRAAFEFYDAEASRVLSLPPAPHGDDKLAVRMALADAASSLWTSWRSDDAERQTSSGVQSVNAGSPLLVAWSARGDRMTAIVGGPQHLRATLASVEPLLQRYHVSLALTDEQHRPLLTTAAVPANALRASRSIAETGLPWTLQVSSRNGIGVAGVAERRRLLIAGIVVAGLLALFGTYAVTRAVTRELDAARMQAEFVSAVSHEFRTPLTSLRQLTELLAAGRVSSEERRAEYYSAIQQETARLHRFVESLLAFGRADAGVAERRNERFDGVALVRDTVTEFGRGVAALGYTVALSAPDETCELRGDQEALKRVLWNLLDNAVKYSPDDRRVEVSVAAPTNSHPERSDGSEGRLTITVRDHGLGIPANEQVLIFEKFRRGTVARERGIRGTGIGLAIVRQIVEAHGGSIEVQSTPGNGSTFVIKLLLPPSAA